MEWIKQNLRSIGIAVGVLILTAVLSYIGGCNAGSKDGFVDGHRQGLEDAKCDGGSHTRPFSKPVVR